MNTQNKHYNFYINLKRFSEQIFHCSQPNSRLSEIRAVKYWWKFLLILNIFLWMKLLTGSLVFSMFPQHIPMCPGSLLSITMPLVDVTACFTVPSLSPVSLRLTPSSRIDSLQATEMVQHFLLSIRHIINGKMWKKVIYSILEKKLLS